MGQRRRALTLQELNGLTPMQQQQLGLTDQPEGAPADFSGPVFANPDHVRPQLDTAPAPAPQLPNGVTASLVSQKQPAETFSDVAPISSAETFSDVTPIETKKPASPAGDTFAERLRNSKNPGVSEGAGLREGLAEWDEKSGGEIFGGLHDLLNGDISKGMHRIFSGAGNAAAPVAALTAPAMIMAPATTLGAAGGGVLAGKATKAAADAIGATPDQAQAAEDVAALAGGIGGAKLAGALTDTVLAQRIAKVLGKTAADAITDVPVIRQLLKFKANWEATAVPKPVYPGAPLPEHPGVFPGAPLPEHPGVFPGAPLPATPAPEVLNPALTSEARTMPGAHSPEVVRPAVAAPVKPAAPLPARPGLKLPGQVATPAAAEAGNTIPAAPKVTPAAKLEDQLTDALGGTKPNVQPGKPIAQRPAAAAAAKSADVPAGFTPVENSSVVKSYKYDPATKEFEAITHSGQRYRAGEVTAEQFAKFEAADSKGVAWNELRKNSTPLGKFVAGKFEPYTKPGLRSADPNAVAPEDAPKSMKDLAGAASTPAKKPAAGPATMKDLAGDLTDVLTKSVDQVKASGKGGAPANPVDLAKRWGVDMKSLKATREQTRNMTAEKTQTAVDELTARYKKGLPVDPVIEYQDADGNITAVDGRLRVMAAKKAGVPIQLVVKRAKAATAQ